MRAGTCAISCEGDRGTQGASCCMLHHAAWHCGASGCCVSWALRRRGCQSQLAVQKRHHMHAGHRSTMSAAGCTAGRVMWQWLDGVRAGQEVGRRNVDGCGLTAWRRLADRCALPASVFNMRIVVRLTQMPSLFKGHDMSHHTQVSKSQAAGHVESIDC